MTAHLDRSAALSRSVRCLLDEKTAVCDVLILGSGYGGAIAAGELAATGANVWVIERGREVRTGEFPEALDDAVGEIRYWRDDDRPYIGNPSGLFDVRVETDCAFVVGNGLGGGSLINAGVMVEPQPTIFDDSRWPAEIRSARGELTQLARHIRDLLGAEEFPGARQLPKYQALERLAGSLEGVSVRPAPIAVTHTDGPNAVGVHQQACIGCGNCVTGCNHAAKNTLAMNAIPLAVTRGASFYTGATALSVARCERAGITPSGRPARWAVCFALTTDTQKPADAETFELFAHTVILAAGALGSTEILMRSSDHLPLSPRLGTGMSGNGDMLAFGFGQGRAVDSTARMTAHDRFAMVGPTIVGIAAAERDGAALPRAAMLQDGSIPYALAPFIPTLLTTLGLAYRNTHDEEPRFYADRPGADPLALHPDISRHCQTLLVMATDQADGRARLQHSDDHPQGRLRVSLGSAANDETSKKIHEALAATERRGFDGGYYVTNPLWKMLPDDFDEVGEDLDSRVLSVHPLGGCPMGADFRCGVVDHRGAVFDPHGRAPTDVHEGLFVMDGSVLPMALGANPALTLSALAMRSARLLAGELGMPRATVPATHVGPGLRLPPRRCPRPVSMPPTVEAGFGELLYSLTTEASRARPSQPRRLGIDLSSAWAPLIAHFAHPRDDADVAAVHGKAAPGTSANCSAKRLFERIRDGKAGLAVRFDTCAPLNDWLAAPEQTAWRGTARLTTYDFGETLGGTPRHTGYWPLPRNDPEAGMNDGHAVALGTPLEGVAELHLLVLDEPVDAADALDRAREALAAYSARRQTGRDIGIRNRRQHTFSSPETGPCAPPPGLIPLGDVRNLFDESAQYFRQALLHSGWRELRYNASFDLRGEGDTLHRVTLTGRKLLAFSPAARNVWDALLEMDLTMRIDDAHPASVPMRIDLLDLLRAGVYQLRKQASTVQTITSLIDLGGFWLRALLATHYWSFAGEDYSRKIAVPRPYKPLSPIRWEDGRSTVPEEHEFSVPRPSSSGPHEGPLRLRLSRYTPPAPGSDRVPLLLIHGLAHGGELFTTPTAPEPMVRAFLRVGREVWVLDHRLSNLLGDTCRRRGSLDEIARHDIPQALRTMLGIMGPHGPRQVDVFAHCVGAGAFMMSVLAGELAALSPGDRDAPVVRSLVLHAVHPWLIPSPYNRVSAALGAFYRDALDDEVVQVATPYSRKHFGEPPADHEDDVPPTPEHVGSLDQLIDRLAASLPWAVESDARHFEESEAFCSFARALCNRVTLFYGPDWMHDNVAPETLEKLGDIMGAAHIDYFKQIFFCALRQRLTDIDGGNRYLTRSNIRKFVRFPVLFATGLENQVFDPRSALRSYVLMNEVLNGGKDEPAVRLAPYLPAGVGHMDFVFGRRSPEIFAVIERWFRDPTASPSTGGDPSLTPAKISGLPPPTPMCGPIVDYQVRHSEAGTPTVVFRAWFELQPHVTDEIVDSGAKNAQKKLREATGLPLSLTALELNRAFTDTGLAIPGTYYTYYLDASAASPEALGRLPALVIHPGSTGRPGYEIKKADPFAIPRPSWLSQWLNLEDRLPEPAPAVPDGTGELGQPPPLPSVPLPVPPDLKRFRERLAAGVIDNLSRRTELRVHLDAHWVGRLAQRLEPAGFAMHTTRILLGSCRWPGMVVEHREVESLFETMLARATSEDTAADGLWLLGDQIYVDAVAGVVDVVESGERAASRYRAAFTGNVMFDEVHRSFALRQLMAQVPTWMVIDDHEFSDNWSGWRADRPPPPAEREDFRQRFAAAAAYQWRHHDAAGQNPGLDAFGRVRHGFWRTFQIGAMPCFAMDTRSERRPAGLHHWRDRELMSPDQLAAFELWLGTTRDFQGPRFVLCGSPFGLLRRTEQEDPSTLADADDWVGYPRTLTQVARMLLDADARNLVFVSGDPHLSVHAAVTVHRGAQSLTVQSIACSGLNASLPFANAKSGDYVCHARIPLPAHADVHIDTTITVLSDCPRQFGEITIWPAQEGSGQSVTLQIHGVEGPLGEPFPIIARTQASTREEKAQ